VEEEEEEEESFQCSHDNWLNMQHATCMIGAVRQVMHLKEELCRQHRAVQYSTGRAYRRPMTVATRYTVGRSATVQETNTQTSAGDQSPDIQLAQLEVVIPTELLLIIH
jgi:hypothetical protein